MLARQRDRDEAGEEERNGVDGALALALALLARSLTRSLAVASVGMMRERESSSSRAVEISELVSGGVRLAEWSHKRKAKEWDLRVREQARVV